MYASCHRLLENAKGSVTILFAILALPIFAFGGMAIDYGRSISVGNRLQAAIDAAALAGAKMRYDDESVRIEEVKSRIYAYFEQNSLKLITADVKVETFKTEGNRTVNVVTVLASAELSTSFAAIFGYSSFRINRTTTVRYAAKKIELSMVLDVTGSMADNNKIGALREAASSIVETLFTDGLQEDTRIALVPYSSSVKLGTYAAAATKYKSTDGCAVERTGSKRYTSAPPGSNAYFNTSAWYLNNHYNCPNYSIQPLTNDKARLLSLISSYTAPSGYTAGHIGTAWGWYTISDNWQGFWSGSSRPADNTPDVLKVMLILTDGLFNTAYTTGTTEPEMIAESLKHFQSLCSAIRNEKITVYTVGLDLAQPQALDSLRQCAGNPGNAFTAQSASALKKAFAEIGMRITALSIAE